MLTIVALIALSSVAYGATVAYEGKTAKTTNVAPVSTAPPLSATERTKITPSIFGNSQLDVTVLTAENGDISNLAVKALTVAGDVTVKGASVVAKQGTFGGALTAGSFQGNGAGVTGVNASLLNGQPGSYYAGLAGALSGLSSNAAQRTAPNTFTATNNFQGLTSLGTANIATANITSGNLAAANIAAATIGSLNLSAPLGVASGGIGLSSVANRGIIYGQTGGTLGVATPGGTGLCLLSGATDVQWGACSGATAVASVDGLSGILTLANSTGSGATLTIDNASAVAKGIAQFNGTNLPVTAGVVNTAQDIAAAASPTFAAVNTNAITPSGALTIGAVAQTLNLQGSATTITANSAGKTTTLALQAPTANVTYRLLTALAGTYDICTTVGNCGGVSTPGGTLNTLAKFTGAQALGNSLITDNGTTVTVGGALTATGTTLLNGDATLGTTTANRLRLNSEILGGSLILQGATDDAFTMTLNISDPLANRTITIPNASGTMPIATSGSSQIGVSAFIQNGSLWAGAANLGTNDAFALNFKTNNAVRVSVTATGDLSFASGAGNFDQSLSTGTFSTGTGAVALNGDTTVATGKTLTVNTITPTAAMVLGATAQSLTLQGDATAKFTATTGGFINTLQFALPAGSNKTVTIPNATGTVAVSATGPLAIDAAGNVTCATCLTSGAAGVSSLNGLTGVLSVANATGSGATITIDDATTAAKGIASFNSTNFSVTSGAVNTVQNINTTASPTFSDLTLTSGTASSYLRTPLIDTATAAALGVGTTNATAINLNQNTAVAAGKTFSAAGTALFKNNANSAAAFQIQNSSAANLVNVDTAANAITLLSSNTGEIGSWATASNPVTNGRQFPSSLIFNGYMYVIGGADGTPTAQNTIYYAKLNADGSPNTWTSAANLPAGGRFEGSAVMANGYMYIFAGIDSSSNTRNTVFYAKVNADGSFGTWASEATNLVTSVRDGHTSVFANGYAYVISGESSSAGPAVATNYVSKLNADGSVGAWSSAGVVSLSARRFASSVAINGYIYVIGGQDTAGASSTVVQYAKQNSDGTVGSWTTTSALPTALDSHSAVVNNGYVYALGGRSSGTAQTGVYYAKINNDGTLGAWATSGKSLTAARYGLTSVVANGFIYALAGNNGGVQSTVYYAPLAKVQIGGDLDLVGLQGVGQSDTGGLSQGGAGGNLTAGNVRVVGGLNVAGQAMLNSGLSVTGTIALTGQTLIRPQADSATAFTVQNAAASSTLLAVDTSAGKVVVKSLEISVHLISSGTAPTIAAGAAACTTPTVSVAGTDTAGLITVTTGTGCAASGKLATITFATAYGAAPKVVLTPAQANATTLQYFYDSATVSTTAFDLNTNTIPANSTTYKYSYHVIQ